jgi:hypothetical protein
MNPLSPASIPSLLVKTTMNTGKKRTFKKKVIVNIPCKPHVLAFIQNRFPAPYTLSLNDWLGIAVYHILRREQQHKYFIADKEEYNCKLPIRMAPEYITDKGVNNLTDYTIYKINNLVESVITDMFLEYMESRPEGVTNKEAIIAWMERYQFLEGKFVNYFALQKKYYRFRQAMERKG